MDEQESSKKREPLSTMEEERPSKVQKNEDLTAPEEIDNRVIEYLYGMEEELLLKKMNFEQRMSIDDTLSIYRAKIVDVLALLSCRLGLDQDTLHTAFSYYDRYNSLNPVVDTDKLELIGVSSLYIAGKYEERVGMKQSFYFVQFTDSPIADGQILNMETEMLGCLRYKLGYPTVKTFLRIFLDKVQKDYEEKNLQLEHMASYIADLSLVEHECCKFKPSLLASSIIFLIKFLIQPNSQPWSSTLEQRFRYMASDMKECVNILYELRSGKRHRTLEIREKYRQDQYQHCRWIGAGAFGKVYQAIDTKINCVVALKLTELEGDGNDGGVPAVSLREMSVLKEMDHENIIKLLDVVHQDGKRLTLVFEFMDGDLLEFMKAHPDRFSDSNLIKRLLFQILSAVDHCHSRRVFHRDLKPANLLVNQKNYTLKVADFGLAKAFSIPQKKCTPQCITLAYRAPEVLLGSTEHYVAADMWSVGCIFAEMVNQERLFDTVNLKRDPDRDFKKEQLSLIFSILGTPEQDSFIGITFPDCLSNFPEHQPPELRVVVPTLGSTGIDLLSKMLCLDPERRITAAAALRHEYFRDIAGQ